MNPLYLTKKLKWIFTVCIYAMPAIGQRQLMFLLTLHSLQTGAVITGVINRIIRLIEYFTSSLVGQFMLL